MIAFAFDNDPVKNEIASHRSVISEFQSTLVNGVLDPVDVAAKMKAKDKIAGIDKICAEYEKQIQKYLTTR